MPKHLIYPLYTGMMAILTFALVPRGEIRRLALYGIIYGAVADVFFILLVGVLRLGEYINYKHFGAFGLPFFPPIAWTFYFIMFLYILPANKPWNYLFPAIASGYAIYFSNILQNLGIFKWHYGNPFLPWLIVYAPWHFLTAWTYARIIDRAATGKARDLFPAPVSQREPGSGEE